MHYLLHKLKLGNSWLTSAIAKRLCMVMGLVYQSGKPVMMITDITPTTLETCCYYFFFYIFSFWVFLSYAIFLSCKNIKLSILFFLKYWALLPFSKYIVYFLSCTISFLVKILILFLKYWALLSFPSICDIHHFLFVMQFLIISLL